VTSTSEYVQLTNFTDSVLDPALSADGRMVAFVRAASTAVFPRRGDIYAKLLPNGDSVRLTNDPRAKYGPVFTPDGARVAYTQTTRSANGLTSDTWVVPVAGGEPNRLLPNASGLIWIDDRHVLFSEIKGTGLHMGIVTATTTRDARREIYFPEHERAMAHYSYLSPDRRSVLIVEMDRTATFQPCRLVPFDGSSAGRQVGPRGACTAAAWSPDGRWMYFSVTVDGASHLWRQRVDAESAEQITFGPVEESGVAVTPDGGALVTAIGQQRSAILIHENGAERQLSIEGIATTPQFAGDGKHLYYLVAQPSLGSATTELRSIDLRSGNTDRLLPDRSVEQYVVSTDGGEVAFTTIGDDGVSEIWLAPLDRSAPPRRVTRGGDQPSFDGGSGLIFRALEEERNYLTRIGKDGNGRERLLDRPILNKGAVSPDGAWGIVYAAGIGANASTESLVVPLRGGPPRRLCPACPGIWSSDGRWLYVLLIDRPPNVPRTIAIPVTLSPPDNIEVITTEATQGRLLPGVVAIDDPISAPGPSPSTYAFVRQDIQRNLFRIPLH